MKYLLALCFSIYSPALFAQETAALEYSPDVDFNWSLFKGKVNPHHIASMGKNTGAVTVSSLNYQTVIRGNKATIKISALFLPSESWTRYPKLDHPQEALNHEKRHFDICEIYARKMRQIISQTHFSRDHFNNQVANIFRKIAIEEQNEQSEYDRETEHSINAGEQKKWNAKIDGQLKALTDYSNTMVTVLLY